jgi:hypothetical protein
MKLLLLLLVIAIPAVAQKVAVKSVRAIQADGKTKHFAPDGHRWVKTAGDKDADWVALGCPTNYPTQFEIAVVNTNGFTLMSDAEIAQRMNAVGPAFTNWFETVWIPHQQNRSTAEAAARRTLQQELAQLEGECDAAVTNWSNLTPPQKDVIIQKLLRIDQLRRP